jgi:hypothetical protein
MSSREQWVLADPQQCSSTLTSLGNEIDMVRAMPVGGGTAKREA